MKKTLTREEIQEKALSILKQNNYTGTICLSTGTGKAKIGIEAIKRSKYKSILITTPRTNLKKNWQDELNKWGIVKVNDPNNENHYRIVGERAVYIDIVNIQSAYKWTKELMKYELIIIDEVHFLSEKYSSYLLSAQAIGIPVIGLTATPKKNDDFKRDILYGQLLPIIYEYYDSEEDGIINKVNYYVWEYDLNDDFKVEASVGKKRWTTGELKYYTYLDKTFNSSAEAIKIMYWSDIKTKAYNEITGKLLKTKEDKDFLKNAVSKDIDYFYEVTKPKYQDRSYSKELYYALKRCKGYNYSLLGTSAGRHLANSDTPHEAKVLLGRYIWSMNERKKLLWRLNSSMTMARLLKHAILKADPNNKVLLFSELTEQADKLSKYSIHSNNGDTAKKVKENNKELLDKFNAGEVRELSSCMSLTLGLNMSHANWAIFESYSGSETNGKQKKGRLNRLNTDEFGNVVILKPKNTQAEVWFKNAFGWIENYTIINNINDLPL